MPVTNLAELDALVERVKAAQAEFATYSQEQVDKIFRAASLAANQDLSSFTTNTKMRKLVVFLKKTTI